jgi:hypothetical protein
MFWKLHHQGAQKNLATNHAKIWMKSMHPTQMPRSGTNKNFAGATNKNPNIFHFEMGPRGYPSFDSTTDKSTYTLT